MPSSSQACRIPCSDDCQMTEWSPWSNCDNKCTGQQLRRRRIQGMFSFHSSCLLFYVAWNVEKKKKSHFSFNYEQIWMFLGDFYMYRKGTSFRQAPVSRHLRALRKSLIHGRLLSGWLNYNYTACCWFPTSSNILILPSRFWQIRFETYWLHCSKCRILVLLRYMPFLLSQCMLETIYCTVDINSDPYILLNELTI